MSSIIKCASSNEGIEPYNLQDNLLQLAKQIELEKQKELDKNKPAPPVGLGVDEAAKQAEDIINTALRRSEEILKIAEEEGVLIRKEAREVGYKEGHEQGQEAGYKQAYEENTLSMDSDRNEIKQQVLDSISELEATKQKLLDQYLEDLKDISVAVAEKVIKVSLKNSGDIIKRMILSATEKLKKTQWAKIYVSKYDAEMMMEGDAQLLNSLSFLSDNIKIITMDKEDNGTCIIELPKEIIDVSVNTQLENIKEILNNVQL